MTTEPEEGPAGVAHLYDWLSRWVQLINLFSAGRRLGDATMHKALAPAPNDPHPEGGTHVVNDLALAACALPPDPVVLDAGCGFGGTMFRWHETAGGRYDGLTLSRVQLRAARREAVRRGVADRCRFHLQSYDAPPPGRYDVVLAIEALMPAPDLGRAIDNLAGALTDGGRLLVVDDMVAGGATPCPAPESELARAWSCAHLPSEADYRDAFTRAGLTLVEDRDLTARVRPRAEATLEPLERSYRRLHRLLPIAGARAVLDAYIGGVALERLYAAGRMRYRLMVGRRG